MAYGSTGRRVAAVSTGTLLLCLWGGGTAFAATSPTADGGLGGVPGAVSGVVGPTPTASPLPVPVPTPSQLDPVSSTVNQAVKTVKTAVQPQATPTATAVPTGGQVHDGKSSGGTVHVPTTAHSDHVLGTQHARQPITAVPAMPNLSLTTGGLRSNGAPMVPTLNPTVAPQQTAVLAAGATPALAPAPQHLRLPGGNGEAPRGLFIALATMVIGGLAAGHVKVAQDRMGYATI